MSEENITLLTICRWTILSRKTILHTYKLPLEPTQLHFSPFGIKQIGRKSRLLMGRGLPYKKFGNSFPLIHNIEFRDHLDGIPSTTLLTKTQDHLGIENHIEMKNSPEVKDLLWDTTENKMVDMLCYARQDAWK